MIYPRPEALAANKGMVSGDTRALVRPLAYVKIRPEVHYYVEDVTILRFGKRLSRAPGQDSTICTPGSRRILFGTEHVGIKAGLHDSGPEMNSTM